MYSNYEVEANKESYKETKTTMETGGYAATSMTGMVTPPVYECPREFLP